MRMKPARGGRPAKAVDGWAYLANVQAEPTDLSPDHGGGPLTGLSASFGTLHQRQVEVFARNALR